LASRLGCLVKRLSIDTAKGTNSNQPQVCTRAGRHQAGLDF
jgi:hypothetical protein